MSLWTLIGAYLPVALVFAGLTALRWRKLARQAVAADALEALAATLLGALWFASLGAGGWLLLFLLLGLVAGLAERGTRIAFLRSAVRDEAIGLALILVRYLAAGAILAWRLG